MESSRIFDPRCADGSGEDLGDRRGQVDRHGAALAHALGERAVSDQSRFRRIPGDGSCALIRQNGVTLFLRAHDALEHAVQQLLDPTPLPALRTPLPSGTGPERDGELEGEDEPAPITLVSRSLPERAVA